MNYWDQSWERLSQVVVKGAEYNSRERQPHPKCLQGTRVKLLGHINGLLDDEQGSRIIWLNGAAGVGKSAVAFTIADRMRGLCMTEQRPQEKRLAGTFFFSRKYANRCTAGYFFATLVYQLASNFPSVRRDVNEVICENPALLDPDKSLQDHMEALFLRPLRRLRFRLLKCPPLVFVVDALDECASEAESTDLVYLLGQALRDPDLPVIHILLTSRSEVHIREAIDEQELRPLVCKIPVNISGEGVTSLISLDGADVDSDICVFLQHSFAKLRNRYSNFPQPTQHDIARLASRAGRRFIVASTMMMFIDDGYSDPHTRLQLMLELTSELLPGTEVYKLYDRILSTCADPKRAHLHLSVVAALANPLSISQLSELLGPGQGRDVESVLVQLRSIMDIPTDSSLPVNIYHSSVRDYALNPSNCSLFKGQMTTSPHSLLAYSSFCQIIQNIPESMGLLDACLELKKQSRAMESHDPQKLRDSLVFIVEPPTPLRVLVNLLWLRGERGHQLWFWLETPDGCAWLRTQGGYAWLGNQSEPAWLQTQAGFNWLQTLDGKDWLESISSWGWLQSPRAWDWLHSPIATHWLESECGKEWLETENGEMWLGTETGFRWLEAPSGQEWLTTESGRRWLETKAGDEWLKTQSGREWLKTQNGREWLRAGHGQEWLQTQSGREWLMTEHGQEWLETQSRGRSMETQSGREWLQTQNGNEWLQGESGQEWLQTQSGREWLKTQSGIDWLNTTNRRGWLDTQCGQQWLKTQSGQEWLETDIGFQWPETQSGQVWLETQSGRQWLVTQSGREWLPTPGGREWLNTWSGQEWLLDTESGRWWLLTRSGRQWLQTQSRREWLQTEHWDVRLQTKRGREWLRTQIGREWLRTQIGREWLGAESGKEWLKTETASLWLEAENGIEWAVTEQGQEWLETRLRNNFLQTKSGQEWVQSDFGQGWLRTKGHWWLETERGREWLGNESGQEWLQAQSGREWLQAQGGREWLNNRPGRGWLQTEGGQEWLQSLSGREWLQTLSGREWLQTQSGREWVQTPHGQAWKSTPAASFWLNIEEFLNTVETITEFIIVPELSVLPVFRTIEEFKSLPDFLMFPAFLTLTAESSTSAISHVPDMELIHVINAFTSFIHQARERSWSSSDALVYACQNWAMHLSSTPDPCQDTMLKHIFTVFWDRHLLSWLERLWCLTSLQSCLNILSEGQRLAMEYIYAPGPSQSPMWVC